ncbi:MAG: universal stress protein [Mycobacterium sp.]|nr:universal stress protein [Mycobacterium sp.]
MSVVVGYLAGKSGTAPLHLAATLARTLRTSLVVASIVPRPWTFPSTARVDAEYAAWADQLAADSAKEAERELLSIAPGAEVAFHSHAHRSVSGGLIEVVSELDAEMLVLGSSAYGRHGQVVVGSTADRLLHSAPVPVAIAPRGYRSPRGGVLTRITCGYPGTPESLEMVRRVTAMAERVELPVRVITFAVRGRTMYPPEVGLHAEDSILAAWESQAAEMLSALRTDGVVGEDVALQVVSGNDWGEAIDDAEWQDGEVLALGTSPRGEIAYVFLGTRGTKIMRVSPVPVLVLPG